MLDKREKLRLKMVSLQNEAMKLREEIATIDNITRKEQIEQFLGRCYKTENTWFRVERFDYKYNRYYGTVIHMYGKGKHKLVNLEFNESIYDSTIDDKDSKLISHIAFKTKLNECGKMIIKAMDYGK